MSEPRLTSAQKQKLIDRALRETARRREANARAHADRISRGQKRLELVIPEQYRTEIRAIVAEALVELAAGREPRLVVGSRAPMVGLSDPSENRAAPSASASAPPSALATRGLGSAERRRLEAGRRRAKQQAAGLTRTTFEAPSELVPRVRALVAHVASLLASGSSVWIEAATTPPTSPHGLWNASPGTRDRTVTAIPDHPETSAPGHETDQSPLFDDIHAAAVLDWGSGHKAE